jgi:membrane fusion protein (multidrug efflux system)
MALNNKREEQDSAEQKSTAKSESDENISNVPFFRQKKIFIPALIILIAAILGIYWYIGQLAYVSTDDAVIDGNRLSISSKILGRITLLTVDEGDSVMQDQLLVQLDSTDLKAQERQAKATLNLARESINLSNVNLAKAQEDFNRAEQQFNENVIPKEQFDHIQKALEVAKAQLNIDKTKIQTFKAQLNVIETELLNTSIYSPMDGVVGKRWVLKGDVVQPGQPIFTIFNLTNIWVTAYLEETKLASINIGDNVDVSVDAYPDQNFAGKVYQIGSNTASQFSLIPPSNASGNFTKVTQRVPIKISIDHVKKNGQPDPSENIKLLPGMSVEIKITIKNK